MNVPEPWRIDHAIVLELAVRLHHGGRIDAQRAGEGPHGGQGVARRQLARRDRNADARGDLRVDRCGTAGIDVVEHGSTVSLL